MEDRLSKCLEDRVFINGRVIAEDGFAGKVIGIDINISDWRVAALSVKVGGWLRSRAVRIPSIALRSSVGNTDMLPVGLKRKQIEESPPTNNDPMSAIAFKEDLLASGVPLPEPACPQLLVWKSIVGLG